jgi:probable addiction module antidote protein
VSKRNYLDGLRRRLQDPEYAQNYVNAAAEESSEGFLLALRDLAEAKKMAQIADAAQVNRESMYRMLSKRGNPRLRSLLAVVQSLGLRLGVLTEDDRLSTKSSARSTDVYSFNVSAFPVAAQNELSGSNGTLSNFHREYGHPAVIPQNTRRRPRVRFTQPAPAGANRNFSKPGHHRWSSTSRASIKQRPFLLCDTFGPTDNLPQASHDNGLVSPLVNKAGIEMAKSNTYANVHSQR